MLKTDIFIPVCLQVLLTAIVWFYMYYWRITEMRRFKVKPDEMANETRALEVFKKAQNPSDNFENLFEAPILLYTACLVIFCLGTVDPIYFFLTLLYVFLRAVHSFVHCTSNKIIVRFWSYAFSTLILWAIWIRIAFQIFHPA